jgi:hypothetical protein
VKAGADALSPEGVDGARTDGLVWSPTETLVRPGERTADELKSRLKAVLRALGMPREPLSATSAAGPGRRS